MADAHMPNGGTIPKLGRVTEICQEWMIREDGAMAYQLQNQEIRQHYSGNKQRNALVREDYPRAKNEQQKEQELAEQAAAVYRRMLEEQEEIDKMLAEKLTKKLELEGRMRINPENLHPSEVIQEELEKPPVFRQFKPNKELYQQSRSIPDNVRSKSSEMVNPNRDFNLPIDVPHHEYMPEEYNEPHFSLSLSQKTQEEADAELARILQEQEGNPEECILERDRLLAIEAQDKELAKVLQERERIKAKKAKERARQKALAKKQNKKQEEQTAHDVIMPDDAYSNPADMILPQSRNSNFHHPISGPPRQYDEYEDNYSLPVDGLDSVRPLQECGLPEYPNYTAKKEDAPVRPSHLGIRPTYKPRYPDPEELCNKQHMNIAIAIDPTYPKHEALQSPGPYLQNLSPAKSVSSKSSARNSPSSSSPRDIDVKLEVNSTPAPPYMPIQGQKRTASLEKKKLRDGCKQQ